MKLFFYILLIAVAWAKPDWLLSHKNNEYTLSKKRIEQHYKDPSKLLGSVTMKFVPGEGKNLFVEISDLKKGNSLEPLGLKKGDVLKSLNGESVNITTLFDPKAQKTPSAWLNKKRYVLILSRNGKDETLIYNVE